MAINLSTQQTKNNTVNDYDIPRIYGYVPGNGTYVVTAMKLSSVQVVLVRHTHIHTMYQNYVRRVYVYTRSNTMLRAAPGSYYMPGYQRCNNEVIVYTDLWK